MRTIDKIRYILNVIFMICAAATLLLYLADSDLFFYAGATAISLKVFEFILRFVN